MSYTIKNLREAKDHAPDFGYDEVQEARFPGRDLEAKTIGLAHLVVKPGKRQAFAHRHEAAEEVYVVLSGSGRIKLDEEVVELGPLDAVRVAPPVTRAFEAGPQGLEVIAFGPHHEKDGDLVGADEFWDGA
jgi:mannose-6-phosphate isomerase-like protein (cupin superfamily)